MEHTVRRAGTADAHLLGQLLFDFNTEFEAPTPTASALAERFRSLLAGTDLVAFLAECAEGVEHPAVRTSGFALLSLRPTPYSEGPLAQLEELYVRPPLRDQGIGTALLGATSAHARSRGSLEMHIGVDEIDSDTRRFYERHGFVNVQPGQDYRMLLYLREL
ncbi:MULTISPECIES: GNAT family N-acetyltransferase [Brevibacterium]|jgi:GNAT superfamily N-acetyltransferase|uniref:GNAT family N-acetyltransferase n=1 Tax=Brevibacterium salitolerans TaxID=1403566 RepID=A0ABN2X387_9MICO|nr:GNAT family N-acetyltransferase [Brevibacterium sp.]